MSYAVKEIFYTLQGEGLHAGTPAVFCRFAGCNLWSGREEDRAQAVCQFCDTDFVGTDGTLGGKFGSADELADAILKLWPAMRASLPLAGSAKSRGLGWIEGGLVQRSHIDQPSPNPTLRGALPAHHAREREGNDTDLLVGLDSQINNRFVVCTGGEPLLQLDAALIDALHRRGFYIAVESNGTLPAPAGIDWLCISPKANAPLRQTTGDELKLVYPQTGIDPKDFEKLKFRRFSLSPMDNAERAANTEKAIAYCLENPRWKLSLQTHKMVGIR